MAVPDKVLGIQFLRALAATMVVMSHLFERLVKKGIIDAGIMDTIWVLGGYGVHIFFAVSGYVIFYACRDRFGASPRESLIFLAKRLVRIYPLYFIMTLIYIVFAFVSKHTVSEPFDVIRSLLFIPYVNNLGLVRPVYMLGWTLNYEMFFYFVFAVLLMFPKKKAVMALVGTFLIFAIGNMYFNWPQNADSVVTRLRFYTNPMLLFFVAGLLSVYLKELPFEKSIVARPVFSLVLTVALFVAGVIFHANVWLYNLCVFLFIRLATRVDYARLMPDYLIRKIQFVGDASYSLYLTHSFFVGSVVIGVSKLVHAPILVVPISIVLTLLACIPIAGYCYRFIERPLLNLGNQWLKSIIIGLPGRARTS